MERRSNFIRRLAFQFSICIFCGLCFGIAQVLHNHIAANAVILLQTAGLLALFTFCGINLFWGVREREIHLSGFGIIKRDKSPANYWVAIGGWTIFTAGAGAAVAQEIYQLILAVGW